MDVKERLESRQTEAKSATRPPRSKAAGRLAPARNDARGPAEEFSPAVVDDTPGAVTPSAPQPFSTQEVRGIADTAQRVAGDLRGQFPETAEYVQGAAAGLKHLLDMLEEPGVARLSSGVRDLARAQPALFIAGGMIVGIVLWRVLSNPPAAEGGGSSGSNR